MSGPSYESWLQRQEEARWEHAECDVCLEWTPRDLLDDGVCGGCRA